MATAQRTQRPMTPNEYRYWWERASDEDIIEAQHPDEYEAEYRASQAQQRQSEAARPPFRGGNAPRFARAPQAQPQAPARGQERQAQSKPQKARNVPVGVALAIFGGTLWLIGARYTLDGWVWGVNLLLSWLSLPVSIPRPVSWFVLLALPLGVLYSAVETGIWYRRSAAAIRSPLFWLAWLAIVGTDVFSTWLGVRVVQPDSWLLTQQVAANGWAALVWALVLTFLPEWAILGARFFLRR